MTDKQIYWMGSSRNELSGFPKMARQKAGFQLRALQRGQKPADFKPVGTVGKGAEEIRIRTENAYRVFYVSKFEEAIYVLYAFQKKTQKTANQDIEVGQKRYQEMMQFRTKRNDR
ncbi:MAG: type II toxin-antitoxin system RelE/ParE family toxin [Phormidesmis sp.]